MSEKVDILNTRAFKKDNGEIVITVGSIEQSTRKVEFGGHTFEIKFGEFASYLKDINYYLERALPYCANET